MYIYCDHVQSPEGETGVSCSYQWPNSVRPASRSPIVGAAQDALVKLDAPDAFRLISYNLLAGRSCVYIYNIYYVAHADSINVIKWIWTAFSFQVAQTVIIMAWIESLKSNMFRWFASIKCLWFRDFYRHICLFFLWPTISVQLRASKVPSWWVGKHGIDAFIRSVRFLINWKNSVIYLIVLYIDVDK